ncbi:hypothetical protein BC827DRAFT_753054 [Russula dissimulans]|nr:hypothetical protein BC827DRAFT_753054 [Russula dissimulans]
MAGLYLWEIVTTLDHEWSVIRGHRPYRSTIWVSSFTRVAALMAVILNLVSIDLTTPYNCEIEFIFQITAGYLAFSAAALLIVFRIIAIWNRDKIIIAIATTIWVTNFALIIHGLVRIRGTWAPEAATCLLLPSNIQSEKLNLIATLVTDISLLVIMLIGLLRLRFHERSALGLGHLLWRQGLIWFLIATLVEVPHVVFICLDLNDPFNYMLWLTSIVAMTIAVTRIHRHLADFSSETTDIWSEPPRRPSNLLVEWPRVHTDGFRFSAEPRGGFDAHSL